MSRLRTPINASADLRELIAALRADYDRKEIAIQGYRYDGTNHYIRWKPAVSVLWVQEHVQSDGVDEGGATYDPADYASSTLVDCRQTRVRETVLADGNWWVWLVPVEIDAEENPVLFDGESGRPDLASFWEIREVSP